MSEFESGTYLCQVPLLRRLGSCIQRVGLLVIEAIRTTRLVIEALSFFDGCFFWIKIGQCKLHVPLAKCCHVRDKCPTPSVAMIPSLGPSYYLGANRHEPYTYMHVCIHTCFCSSLYVYVLTLVCLAHS